MRRGRLGISLIELLVVIVIIGVLSSIVIPLTKKTVETAKFNNAVSVVAMVASANRLFMADYPGVYVSSQAAVITNSATCPSDGKPTSPGQLIGCGYLSGHAWSGMAYDIYVCNPSNITDTNNFCCNSASKYACAIRKNSAGSPYNTWRVLMGTGGNCWSYGTYAPPCPQQR
ncbi:MAG: prepilin-type N-terminal cleavage/methylation domain-containing protein [Elusimicrobia bacterium]|nr:prepilin-type N-terminal cleavage/methylation domain-containing protein [Elusimicrobiota bacterium]